MYYFLWVSQLIRSRSQPKAQMTVWEFLWRIKSDMITISCPLRATITTIRI